MRKRDAKVEDHDLIKHFSILNDQIYHNDTRRNITKQQYVYIDGYSYNVRKIAFFLIHERWPAHNFLLPWE